jgi:hypothetical protein
MVILYSCKVVHNHVGKHDAAVLRRDRPVRLISLLELALGEVLRERNLSDLWLCAQLLEQIPDLVGDLTVRHWEVRELVDLTVTL